jgi:uncharacterized protein (TIGR03000 family)
MMSHPRFFLLAAPAVAAAALLFAGGAEAGPKGGGGGHAAVGHAAVGHAAVGHAAVGHAGAVHVGTVHAGSFHGAAVHHVDGFHHDGFHHGHGSNFFLGVGVGGYPYGLGYGGYYGGYYPSYGGSYASDYYPQDYYSAPAASYYSPPSPSVYNVADPNARGGAAQQDPIAHVMVKVPADAEVWFGSGKTQQTGAQREFVSPALTPGKDYSYEVKARWTQDGKEVVQTRQIDVAAGAWKVVDFTKPAPEQLEPPKPKE